MTSALLSLQALYSSRQHNTHTLGATAIQFLPQLRPGERVQYVLPASVRRIEELALFVDSNSYQSALEMPLNISIGVGTVDPLSRDVRLGEWDLAYREFVATAPEPTALVFSRLNYRVSGDDPIVLDIYIPNYAKNGLLLLGSTAFDAQRNAGFTDESIIQKPGLAGMQLGVQTRYTKSSRFNDITVVAAVLFLLATWLASNTGMFEVSSRAIPKRKSWPVFLALVAFLIPLAELAWQKRLDEYWNYFWPDNYVGIAYQIDRWWGGATSWDQFIKWLAADRNGQAWVYPFFVAALYQIDIAWLNAFTSANLLLTFIMLVCWWRLLRIYVVDMYLVLAAFLLIACHHLHLQSMLTPITDIAGAAVVAVFYLALHYLIGDGKFEYWRRSLSVVVVAICITVGIQTRIALLPLASVPAGLAVLLMCRERKISEQQVMLFSTSVLASLMVITCYYALNLTGTLFVAASTATDVSFSGLFSYLEFGLFSALNLGVPLLVCVICWWRASAEPMVLAVGIFSFAYLVMLMLAQIVSWERYWVPLIGPAVFAMAVCLARRPSQQQTSGLSLIPITLLIAELWYFQFSGY
ncbi:MAG: hypothetical protein P8J68_11620 [Arenicellaceae bacterium]|nr:hypothetical protein [Arenicellaceae bacterium]